MAGAAAITAGGSILGGILGGKGASAAAQAQARAAKNALAQQSGQFAVTQGNVNPYVKAGQTDLGAIQDLLGMGGSTGLATGASPADQVKFLIQTSHGKDANAMHSWLAANPNATPDQQLAALQGLADPTDLSALERYASSAGPYSPAGPAMSASDAQQAAINNLKASPAFTSLYNTGADTIDQNAAATGGLRGGNTQNSLAQFGSNLLAQVIQQQLANLSGVSGQGLSGAIGLGNISQNNANAQSNIYGQIGSANAVGAAAPYAALQGIISQLTGGGQASLGNFFGGGGGSNAGVVGFGNNTINSMGSIPLNFG